MLVHQHHNWREPKWDSFSVQEGLKRLEKYLQKYKKGRGEMNSRKKVEADTKI